jgi:CRISPR-associated DxTHG motif protein
MVIEQPNRRNGILAVDTTHGMNWKPTMTSPAASEDEGRRTGSALGKIQSAAVDP